MIHNEPVKWAAKAKVDNNNLQHKAGGGQNQVRPPRLQSDWVICLPTLSLLTLCPDPRGEADWWAGTAEWGRRACRGFQAESPPVMY